ncbi:MAG: LOG family protein [Nitrospinae bacterium]|nr:LOG family protein [Nitrospinota bacterium]
MPNSRYIVGDPKIDQSILELSQNCASPECADLLREMLTTLVKLGREHADIGDFKLVNSTLKELRHALRIFLPRRGTRKAAFFGSARTKDSDPCYQMAHEMAAIMAGKGFMVVSGGGGGIMEAANRGAGNGNSFGLNIKLPFEQKANQYIQGSQNLMNFKYFFTRKLMFIKETNATALFPGGFGTLDEGFENITLFQTGKSLPRPIVLMEPPDSDYWENWLKSVKRDLLGNDYISEDDLKLFRIFHSAEEGARYIVDFYRAYHSLRYVRDLTVLRFTKEIPQQAVKRLNGEFKDILRNGDIQTSPPLPEEVQRNEHLDLPRLVFNYNKRNFGRLLDMIHFINQAV